MTDSYRMQWREDAGVLSRIGVELFARHPVVTVQLSNDLAAEAVAAWERNDDGPVDLENESPAERTDRHRSGSLALIGLAISEAGEGWTVVSR